SLGASANGESGLSTGDMAISALAKDENPESSQMSLDTGDQDTLPDGEDEDEEDNEGDESDEGDESATESRSPLADTMTSQVATGEAATTSVIDDPEPSPQEEVPPQEPVQQALVSVSPRDPSSSPDLP